MGIVLWFLRKVLRKLARGSYGPCRVPARVMPGDPGYSGDIDRPRDIMLVMLAPGWQHPVPGSRLSCLTYRQYNSLELMVHDRFSGRLDRQARPGGRGARLYIAVCIQRAFVRPRGRRTGPPGDSGHGRRDFTVRPGCRRNIKERPPGIPRGLQLTLLVPWPASAAGRRTWRMRFCR